MSPVSRRCSPGGICGCWPSACRRSSTTIGRPPSMGTTSRSCRSRRRCPGGVGAGRGSGSGRGGGGRGSGGSWHGGCRGLVEDRHRAAGGTAGLGRRAASGGGEPGASSKSTRSRSQHIHGNSSTNGPPSRARAAPTAPDLRRWCPPDRTIRRVRHAAPARHLVQAGRIRQSVTPGRLKLPASS